jgi:hypothetical protein
MDPLHRFLAYFQDFELTYVDDDWARLEQYFAPDAVYRIEGAGSFDGVLEGRDAILGGIRRFLDGFDRQCHREIRPVGAPVVEGNTVRVRGHGLYRRGESPVLVLDIEESAEFENGVIVRLTDRYLSPVEDEMNGWMERWGQGLSASYV